MEFRTYHKIWLRHFSGGDSEAITGKSVRDLWRPKWQWSWFSRIFTSVTECNSDTIQKLPRWVNTTYILQAWRLTRHVSTNKCTVIVTSSCYISQLNGIINSQRQFLGIDTVVSTSNMFPLNITPRMFHILHSQPVLVLHSQQLL
jgi:hypothetical protein